MIVEESLIKKNFGGDDMTRLLFNILTSNVNRNYFPSEYFSIDNPYHFRIFEKLKENECEFPLGNLNNASNTTGLINSNLIQNSNKNIKFWLHRRNNSTKVFNITTNESLYLCGISLFYPTIYETIKQINIPYLTHYNDSILDEDLFSIRIFNRMKNLNLNDLGSLSSSKMLLSLSTFETVFDIYLFLLFK